MRSGRQAKVPELPTTPRGVYVHRIVARLSLLGVRGEHNGHAILCSCGRWIETDTLGETSPEVARVWATETWEAHAR
jgi:hypothetical protein